MKTTLVIAAIFALLIFLSLRRRRGSGSRVLPLRDTWTTFESSPVSQLGKPIVGRPNLAGLIFETVSGTSDTDYKCGHRGPETFMLRWIDRPPRPVPPEVLAKRQQCPTCICEKWAKAVIPCGICGEPIFPGDPVALYGGQGSAYRPDKVTLTNDGRVIGCLGMDCCPSGALMAGHWEGTSFMQIYADGASIADRVLITGNMMVGNFGPEGTTIREVPLPRDKPNE